MKSPQPPQSNVAQRAAPTADAVRAWVEQARSGDQAAFHRLVDCFQPEIFRMIYYRTQSKMDAEDLTQDVFLQAFKHLPGLQAAAVFRSWLYRIAVNRVRDHFRKKRLMKLLGFASMDAEDFQETEEMAVEPQAAEHLDRQAFWDQIRGAMRCLSFMEREVFTLRFFDELSLKDIGAALKKNESTIKTHLYRAMSKVRDFLSEMNLKVEDL